MFRKRSVCALVRFYAAYTLAMSAGGAPRRCGTAAVISPSLLGFGSGSTNGRRRDEKAMQEPCSFLEETLAKTTARWWPVENLWGIRGFFKTSWNIIMSKFCYRRRRTCAVARCLAML